MRIALISTCAIATPPKAYGGTELVVAELAKGLAARGHDVTVFATADSEPAGTLRAHFERPVWPPNELAEMRHAAHAFRDITQGARPFDVVHVNHASALPFSLLYAAPTVYTLHHTRVEELVPHYRDLRGVAYVAISARQRELVPEVSVARVIHHGLDPARYPEGDGAGAYAAFLGRFAPEKAPHLAIAAAEQAGIELRLGGAPHEVGQEYYATEVAPSIARSTKVRALGELGHESKVAMLRGARCLLFPLAWEEPFGLVMIESMLVGTPVIAFARGSAPEVVENGVTGFLVGSVSEMAQRIRDAASLDRRRCRDRARERWSHLRMTRDYERLYDELARTRAKSSATRRVGHHGGALDSLGR